MNDREYKQLRDYMAPGQKIRLDTGLFSSRERSGIVNSIKQGYWLSTGKISWLGAQIADEYGLPYVRSSQSNYGGISWNTTAGELPGMGEAITALYAYIRMVDGEQHRYTKQQFESAIADPINNRYVPARQMSDMVRAQFGALNAPYKDQINKFLTDWEANNVWISIS